MTTYYLLLLIPALLSLGSSGRHGRYSTPALGFVIALFAFAIGFRHKVGMDWNNYLYRYNSIKQDTSFYDALFDIEPAFSVLNWVSHYYEFGIYGVNIIVAVVFALGFFLYARKCTNIWTAVTVATPYLVIVISMSATRQAAAIGIFLAIMAYWDELNIFSKVLLIALAFCFHVSAIVLFMFLLYDTSTNRLFRYVMLAALGALSYYYLTGEDHIQYYQRTYIERNLQSVGALFHILLSAIPAVLFFQYRKRFEKVFGQDRLLALLSLLSLLAIPALVVSSTGVDRLTLYFTAVQMKVFSAAPLIATNVTGKRLLQFSLVGYSLLIMYIWLNYANNSRAYIPYKNILFM